MKEEHTDQGSEVHCLSLDRPAGREVVSSLSPRVFKQSPPNWLDRHRRAKTRQDSLPSASQIPGPFSSVHLLGTIKRAIAAGV